MPSLYAANSLMASLNRSIKAALITPFVSSLALTWKTGEGVKDNQFQVRQQSIQMLASTANTEHSH